MGKVFLKVKLKNFERIREEKIVYGVDNLRRTIVCNNLFSIVNYVLAGGTQSNKIFELNVYDGNGIFTLNGTKEAFEELFESVDFKRIKIPLVKFDESLYKMIQGNQDRYFDITSVEHLSGKSIEFSEEDFDNGLIAIDKNEDDWDNDQIILSSLMVDLKKLAKIVSEEELNEIKEIKTEPLKKEIRRSNNEIKQTEYEKLISKCFNDSLIDIDTRNSKIIVEEVEEASIKQKEKNNKAKRMTKNKTDESTFDSLMNAFIMQNMMNLFNQQPIQTNKTNDEIKLENLKNFLKKIK